MEPCGLPDAVPVNAQELVAEPAADALEALVDDCTGERGSIREQRLDWLPHRSVVTGAEQVAHRVVVRDRSAPTEEQRHRLGGEQHQLRGMLKRFGPLRDRADGCRGPVKTGRWRPAWACCRGARYPYCRNA